MAKQQPAKKDERSMALTALPVHELSQDFEFGCKVLSSNSSFSSSPSHTVATIFLLLFPSLFPSLCLP